MPFVVRYFCCASSSSDLGKLSLAYADAIASLGLPLRIVSVNPADLAELVHGNSRWKRHALNFLTPIGNSFVNVVCGTPWDWKRHYTIGVRNVLVTASGPPREGDNFGELIRNITIPASILDDEDTHPEIIPLEVSTDANGYVQVARTYQHVLVPSEEISLAWQAVGVRPLVIPMNWAGHAQAFREALLP